MADTAVATQTKTTTAPVAVKADDVIAVIAHNTETLTKQGAIQKADQLAEDIERNSFELGGALLVVFDQGWFDPYPNFGEWVENRYGFAERKARYLMDIYKNLTTKHIPWSKVSVLGWTKVAHLAGTLTPENVDEWVEKAKSITVKELLALLKAPAAANGATPDVKATSDQTTLKFKLKADQLEIVQTGLQKGKAEFQTEFDNVVLERIFAGFLGGTVQAASGGGKAFDEQMKEAGWEKTLGVFEKLFPNIDLKVDVKE